MIKSLQDPRYKNVPLLLPNAWHGSGSGVLSAQELKAFNVRDIGLDPAQVANQPQNKMLRTVKI